MFTLVAYGESIDGAAVLHYIAAVADQHVTVNGDDIYIPRGMKSIIGYGVLSAADTALTDARILSPSLRQICNLQPANIVNAETFGAISETEMFPTNPVPVTEDEAMSVQINSDDSAGDNEYALVWLADGAHLPVNGMIYTVRATAAITLSENAWVNGGLTFDQDLAVGVYDIVGLRVKSANGVAARLVIPGYQWRPGVPCVNALGENGRDIYRFGRMGVFGRFHTSQPPTMDCLGITDTAQIVHLDIIKTG